MTSQEYFIFLDEKRKLMSRFLRGDSEAHLGELFSRLKNHSEEVPQKAWRELDRTLDRFIAEEILEEDEAGIRTELTKQFGYSSLAAEPTKILKRIERAGSIANEKEAELVDRYLAGDFLGNLDDAGRIRRFKEMARSYYEKTRAG